MRWLAVLAGFVLLLGADGGGCSAPPHVVGVQDYGSITGRILDATTNLPIPDVLVSVGSLYTASTDAKGAFVLSHVPIGQQTVTIRAPAYTTVTDTVMVTKDQGVSIGYARLVPIAMPAGMTTLPPPPVPSEQPSEQPSPVPPETPKP